MYEENVSKNYGGSYGSHIVDAICGDSPGRFYDCTASGERKGDDQ